VSVVSDDLEREIWGSFGPQQYVFLATAEGDKPRVRRFYIFEKNSTLL